MTYNFITWPNGSRVRLLVADTDAAAEVFTDAEIEAALAMESSQALFTGGGTPPPLVYSYLNSAALLLESLSGSRARQCVTKLLDVSLDGPAAAKALLEVAKRYRDRASADGSFAIAQLAVDAFAQREVILADLIKQSA